MDTLNIAHAGILKNLSIDALNDMQKTVIEKAAVVPHLMLLAPTGSGKTLAFLIPVLNRLNADLRGVQALIIAPSRELALQIEQVFRSLKTNFKVSCCYGGHPVKTEQNSLSEAPALIIGTPGRIADHLERKSFDAGTIHTVVLDEFDKSLQLGFQVQLTHIFRALNQKQHHILTSATKLDVLPKFLPFTAPEILDYLEDDVPVRLDLKLVKTKSTEKVETLLKLVSTFKQEACLVFCNHRDAVERISALFESHHFEHGIFHGLMEQLDREKSLIRFRGGAHQVLIATDLASRGLDIPEIKHVVHYQLPHHLEEFTHRNGRTARMKANGEAYLMLADDENLPAYIEGTIKEIQLPKQLTLPAPPAYVLLYVSVGKKDKISKGDIAGLLMKKGGLKGDEIGLITTLDHASYVSVNRNLVDQVLAAIKDEKLKKMKVKIEVAR